MKPHKFNNKFFQPLLSKIKAESNATFLADDFNFNLIKYSHNKGTAEFPEHLFTNNLIPQMTLSTRSMSLTLIDNIFINNHAFCYLWKFGYPNIR